MSIFATSVNRIWPSTSATCYAILTRFPNFFIAYLALPIFSRYLKSRYDYVIDYCINILAVVQRVVKILVLERAHFASKSMKQVWHNTSSLQQSNIQNFQLHNIYLLLLVAVVSSHISLDSLLWTLRLLLGVSYRSLIVVLENVNIAFVCIQFISSCSEWTATK